MAQSAAVLARSHVTIAGATWLALWWRPLEAASLGPLLLPPVPLVTPPGVDPAVTVALTLGCVAFGALLPDLDHPQAWLARLRLARRGLLRYFRPFALPAAVVHEEFGHRGGLHSLLAALVVYATGLVLEPSFPGAAQLSAAVAWGYALHLLADLLTARGVPLLYPLWRRRWHPPRPLAVRTGGPGEALYVLLTLALSALYALGPLTAIARRALTGSA